MEPLKKKGCWLAQDPEEVRFEGVLPVMEGLDELFIVKEYPTNTLVIPCFQVTNTNPDSHQAKSPDLEGDHHHPSSLSIDLRFSRQATTDYDLTGQILWPVSVLLSHYLASSSGQAQIRGAHLVELGAGVTGLPSLVAAHFARRVVTTDGNDDVVLTGLQNNVSSFLTAKGSTVCAMEALPLSWGDESQILSVLAALDNHVDVVIGADIVQWPDGLPALLETTASLLRTSMRSERLFILGIVHRWGIFHDFFTLAAAQGFNARCVEPAEYLAQGLIPDSCREDGGRTTAVYILQLTS